MGPLYLDYGSEVKLTEAGNVTNNQIFHRPVSVRLPESLLRQRSFGALWDKQLISAGLRVQGEPCYPERYKPPPCAFKSGLIIKAVLCGECLILPNIAQAYIACIDSLLPQAYKARGKCIRKMGHCLLSCSEDNWQSDMNHTYQGHMSLPTWMILIFFWRWGRYCYGALSNSFHPPNSRLYMSCTVSPVLIVDMIMSDKHYFSYMDFVFILMI